MSLTVGPFSAGEVPPSPLSYRYDDLDLSNYTAVTLRHRKPDGSTEELAASFVEPRGAEGGDSVEYVWETDTLALAGRHGFEFWVDDEIASEPVYAYVRRAIAVA